jgi:RimJ/RimL family protein N-acetyltransferase
VDSIARLANDKDIARMTARLPWPYTREDAQKWVDGLPGSPNEHVFAILSDGEFAGITGLTYDPEHDRAELGYWLGRLFWGSGAATAAARLAVDFAFRELRVRRVCAYCFAVNAASKRVLEKSGLVFEGCLKRHTMRMGEVHDLLCFGLLREEYAGKDARKSYENV